MNATIADSLFMQYGKTIKCGGGNQGISPTLFEWTLSDPETARFVTDSDLKHAPGPGQVAFLLESFFLHPENYLTAMQKPFDHVLTHNLYFARNKGWLWYPGAGSWVGFDDWRVYEKSRDFSILLSPKKTMPGHILGHEVIREYEDRFQGIYGLNSYAAKLDALAPYRFSVVIEAEKVDGFFTEKLIDCLSVGTIPIYWGCPNISDYFNPLGIIQVDSLEAIGRALEIVDREFYEKRLGAVRSNLKRARKYAIPEDWIFKEYPFLF